MQSSDTLIYGLGHHSSFFEPDMDVMIKGATYSIQILQSTKQENDYIITWFDDNYYPGIKDIKIQDHAFITHIMKRGQFEPSVLIGALVYLFRYHSITNCPITKHNWRLLFFVCIMMSQKVLEDCTLLNSEVNKILPITVKEFNCLERYFMRNMAFDLSMDMAIYGRFYYDLCGLVLMDVPIPFPNRYKIDDFILYVRDHKFNKGVTVDDVIVHIRQQYNKIALVI